MGGDRNLRTWALLCAIVLLGVVARVWNIADESPWHDETITLVHLDAPDLSTFMERINSTGTPTMPAYFVLEYLWSQWFGSSVISLRLLSILLSVLTIPATFVLARRFYDSSTGLLAAFLMAASLSQIYYGQEIRMYAQMPLLAIASVYTLYVGLQDKRYGLLVANVIVNVLLAWTHSFATFLLLAEGIYMAAFHWRNIRVLMGWGIAHFAMTIAYIVWIRSQNLSQIIHAAHVIRPATFEDLVMAGLVYSGGRPTNENPAMHLPIHFSLDGALLIVTLLLAGGAVGWILWNGRNAAVGTSGQKSEEREKLALQLIWLLAPPLLLLLVSWLWRPVFMNRYALHVSVPLCILTARGALLLPGKKLRVAGCGLLVMLCLYQLSAIAVGPFRQDWGSASRYVEENRADDDAVFCYKGLDTGALRYTSKLPEIGSILSWSAICGSVRNVTDEGRTAWLFVVLWADPSKFETCFESHGMPYSTTDFAGWPNVRVYRITPSDGESR